MSETYPPEVNGVASTLARVVDGLRARGHGLQLVRPRQHGGDRASEGEMFSEVLVQGLPIPRYPQLRMGIPAPGRLHRLWTRERPDVVHLVTEGPLGWAALRAARRLHLPVVSDFRTNFHAYSDHYGLAWMRRAIVAYLRSFHNATACTMVPTDTLRTELTREGFERLRVVARGVDARLFTPDRRSAALRASWGVGDDGLVALCVGRIAPEKNLGTVLEAVQVMRTRAPDLKLVLVGDGPDVARLKARCPDVIFAGLRRGEDLAAHYASADVFLFSSMTETFGNVVPEAMASGLPLVAYDLAAASQLVRSGDNGLLARAGDDAAFRGHALQLAGDRGLARLIGQQARRSALELDWARIVDAVETEYAKALPQPRAGVPARWKPALPAS